MEYIKNGPVPELKTSTLNFGDLKTGTIKGVDLFPYFNYNNKTEELKDDKNMNKSELADYILEPTKTQSKITKTDILNKLDKCNETIVHLLKDISSNNNANKSEYTNTIVCILEKIITIKLLIKDM